MKTCVCQGMNPDCYQCGGRGYLDEPLAQRKEHLPTKQRVTGSNPVGFSKKFKKMGKVV